MLSDLIGEQRVLAEFMSSLSENAYCAGWMDGLEFALWQVLLGERREYGRLVMTGEDRWKLRSLSDAAAGWIVFDDDREETWISFEDWKIRFQAWQALEPRTRGGAAPSAEPSNEPYSREELRVAEDGRWPERGDRCLRCGVLVPRFADLTDQDRERILDLKNKNRPSDAMFVLRKAIGAPLRFAKIWVLHSGRPQPRHAGPPCPHCREPLASERAKQCLHCHTDWH
jgi:hypothetical protein